MTQQLRQLFLHSITYSLIVGATSFLFFLVMVFTDQSNNQSLAMISYLILIVFIILAMNRYKSENGGILSFKNGVLSGLLISLLSQLIYTVSYYLYTTFIDSELSQRILEEQKELLEGRGLTDQQVKQALELYESLSDPFYGIFIGTGTGTLIGFIFTLFLVSFMKNEDNDE